MPMAHVRPFLKRVLLDKELREALMSAADGEERAAVLAREGFEFTDGEFEDGYRATLVGLQFEADADRLKEFKIMWDMLRRMSP